MRHLARSVSFTIWSALAFTGCSRATAPSETPAPSSPAATADTTVDDSELATMTLAPRPDWANKYAGSLPDDRYFDIAGLMKTHGLTRMAAVEVQNHFRDLTRAEPEGDRQAQYAEALRRAKEGIYEDGRDPKRIEQARFLVLFDLDETMLDQYIDDEAVARSCHDLEIPKDDGSVRYVKLNPGWADAIRRVQSLGGQAVIFSANLDDRCYSIAKRWSLDGVPLLEHPAVAGFMTNSHLIQQSKAAGDPVVEPSKDLRIVDPDLTRAIIVDDNPSRLFQFRNVRLFKKFEADDYCVRGTPGLKKAHESGLKVVLDEVEDAVRYMDDHPGATFVDAYLPYSVLGQAAVRWLRAGSTRSEADAIAVLRAHPELADRDF